MGLFRRKTQVAAWAPSGHYADYDESGLPIYDIVYDNASLPGRHIIERFRPIPHPEQHAKWTVLNETIYLVTSPSEVPWRRVAPFWPATANSPLRTGEDAAQEAHRAAVSAFSPDAAQEHTWDGQPFGGD